MILIYWIENMFKIRLIFLFKIYIKIQHFEKAKSLLRNAYKLKKKCAISSEIGHKLKHGKFRSWSFTELFIWIYQVFVFWFKKVINIIKSQKEINTVTSILEESDDSNASHQDKNIKLVKIYEKLGDSFCSIGLYELGVEQYIHQVILKC